MEQETAEIEVQIPLMRSCRKEEFPPIEGVLQGHIPEWLQGTLVRVGSGLLEVGPDRYNHIFDGLALLHRFSIRDGKVTYQNKFLRSDAYKKNMAANRIVVSEFGTRAPAPDPCKTIFQRLSSYFWPEDFTDNDLVNIIRFSDEYYACSETNFIWRIDPENLDSVQKVCLTDHVPIRTATAHAHEDRDGTVYNVGLGGGSSAGYTIMKFPPKGEGSSTAFDGGSTVCRIPFSRTFSPSYFHSFGMTDNYFIFLEQPLTLSLPRLLLLQLSWKAYSDSLQWLPECKSRFFVVRRKDGLILSQQYLTDALMIFHHINAYEEDNQLVVDMCCYDDGKVIESLYVQALRDHVNDPETLLKPYLLAKPKRYVIPLTIDNKTSVTDNLVKIEGCKARAFQQINGTVMLEPEVLAEKDCCWFTELPRINYELCNGRKYNYFYAVGRKETARDMRLVKINAQTGATCSWGEDATNPSEPIFVSQPDAKDEDDGVIIASLLSKTDDKKVSLVILDAKTMKELARADFIAESSVPADFHGIFIRS